MSHYEEWFPTFGTGNYGGLDGRYPRKRKKGPIGFAKLETKAAPRPTRKSRKK